jgi:EmrB/QacA subfamily drug resistance transporter
VSHTPSPTEARRRSSVTLTVLSIACVAYVLQQTLVVPALPIFQQDLHTSATWAAWVFTGFLLTSAVATTPLGKLGDTYGKRKLLAVALGIFAVGTIGAALATSIATLVAARALQGAAGAIFPLAFGIVRDEFPRERVGVALGLLSATFGVGAGVGLVLSGVILEALSWHWLFWFGAIPVVIALVLVLKLIPESPVRTPSRFDVWGVLTLSLGLGALLLALSEGERWGWHSALTLGVFAASFVILAVWVWVETTVPDPMMDISVMRQPAVFWTNVLAFVVGFSMYSTYLLMPTLIQLGHGLPAALAKEVDYGFSGTVVVAGLYLLPATITMLLVGPLGGAIEPRVGARALTFVGLLAIGVAALLLTVAHSTGLEVVIAIAILGAGIGLVYSMLAKLVVDAVAPSVTGVAMGVNTVMRTVGGTVGGQLSAAFLTSFTVAGTGGLPAETAFTLTFLVAGIGAIIGLAAVLPIPRRPPVEQRTGMPLTADVADGTS